MKAHIIGVREGPLSAYKGTAAKYFPHSVPLSEVGFALNLMRAKKVEEVFMPEHNTRAKGDDPRTVAATGPRVWHAVYRRPRNEQNVGHLEPKRRRSGSANDSPATRT